MICLYGSIVNGWSRAEGCVVPACHACHDDGGFADNQEGRHGVEERLKFSFNASVAQR